MAAVNITGTFAWDSSGNAVIHITKNEEASDTKKPPSAKEFFQAVESGLVQLHASRADMKKKDYYILLHNIQRQLHMTKTGIDGQWSEGAWNMLLKTVAKAKKGTAKDSGVLMIKDMQSPDKKKKNKSKTSSRGECLALEDTNLEVMKSNTVVGKNSGEDMAVDATNSDASDSHVNVPNDDARQAAGSSTDPINTKKASSSESSSEDSDNDGSSSFASASTPEPVDMSSWTSDWHDLYVTAADMRRSRVNQNNKRVWNGVLLTIQKARAKAEKK